MFHLSNDTRVIVQGITGHQGRFHTRQMLDYGTNIVGGVVPGKGGELVCDKPVFNDVVDAIAHTGAECSVVFVPAERCLKASIDAIDSGIETLVVITEHVPLHDAMILRQIAKRENVRLIGPNCPGICLPGKMKLGIMPNSIFLKGGLGVVSRSGTLTYEVIQSLTDVGLGQLACIGIGGDPVPGTNMTEALMEMIQEPDLEGIVMIGEIGGMAEQNAAILLQNEYTGPVVAFIAGRTAPPEKRMGHAGAIVSNSAGSFLEKREMLIEAGISVCDRLEDVPFKIRGLISGR